jgi:CHASE1-domain containing sensor protein
MSLVSNPSTPIKHLPDSRSTRVVHFFAGRIGEMTGLAAGLVLTILFTVSAYQSTRRDDDLRFERRTSEATALIQARIQLFSAILDQTRAVFSIKPDLTEAEFNRLVDGMQLRKNYIGITAIGWMMQVPRSQVASLERKRHREGRSEFHAWPQAEGDERFLVSYIAPLDERNKRAIGLDMHTEIRRRTAAEIARDTGLPTLSEKLTLVQEDVVAPLPGFLLFVPVYKAQFESASQTVAQRRQNLIGWIYGAFRSPDVFGVDLRSSITTSGLIDVEIFDGPAAHASATHLLFDSDSVLRLPTRAEAGRELSDAWRFGFSKVESIQVAGRPWTLYYEATPEFTARSSWQFVWFALAGGLVLTFLFYKVGATAKRKHESLPFR